ncbi:DMT family transporter [Vibrio tritonius]|uniref:DMT family transporter n=1 Tax=Vibrio tritonius TaxID=1435069 RepID=A0ABS7YL61_9VIBR|nr:DMT family transporter [Vibrio tritonius]MCA2014949.1 DMT family transporter [Vibrio tritonius]
MPTQVFAIAFMLCSTLSLSLSGLMTKYLSDSFATQQLAFLRFALPGVLLMVVMMVTRFRLPMKAMRKALFLRSLCMAGCQLCFIYSLQTLSLVESVVLFSTGPLFIPLLEKLFFHVQLKVITLISLVITFSGVMLLAGDVSGIHWRPELAIGVLAGFFNAGSQLCLYRVTKSDMRNTELNAWSFVMAALALTPFLMTSPFSFSPAGSLTGHDVLMGIAVFAIALLVINTQLFRAKAYRIAESGSQLAPLIFTNLMFSALWQTLFFDVQYSNAQRLGLTLIVASTVFVGFGPKLVQSLQAMRLRHA